VEASFSDRLTNCVRALQRAERWVDDLDSTLDGVEDARTDVTLGLSGLMLAQSWLDQQAREIGRLAEPRGGKPEGKRRTPAYPVVEHLEALHRGVIMEGYDGLWVALNGTYVVASAPTLTEVIGRIDERDGVEVVFRVPKTDEPTDEVDEREGERLAEALRAAHEHRAEEWAERIYAGDYFLLDAVLDAADAALAVAEHDQAYRLSDALLRLNRVPRRATTTAAGSTARTAGSGSSR
jgi:hypothetical protein